MVLKFFLVVAYDRLQDILQEILIVQDFCFSINCQSYLLAKYCILWTTRLILIKLLENNLHFAILFAFETPLTIFSEDPSCFVLEWRHICSN